MSYVSNMNFEVNSDAIFSQIINGEIQARMCCMGKYPQNPEKQREELRKYKEAGIVDSTPSIVNFIREHRSVFTNRKLVNPTVNIFDEMITIAPNSSYDESVKSRMTICHDLSPEEMVGMDQFLQDFHSLEKQPDVKEKIEETKKYAKGIERLWRMHETDIMNHVQSIIGELPKTVGKVNTYVMYPNANTHRSCQLSENTTSLFLGKRGADSENKILAHLTHQAVHQPMLPYKISMSKQEKDKFHCFIKFLTDKEIFSRLSGESELKITTPQENHELMGKVYPYWLGYRFRNAQNQGLNPAEEIEKVIQRDMEYYQSLPENSKAKKHYEHYDFDKLDATKIAAFFRYKKGMSPYDFVKIDFDNKYNVWTQEALTNVETKTLEENIR